MYEFNFKVAFIKINLSNVVQGLFWHKLEFNDPQFNMNFINTYLYIYKKLKPIFINKKVK